MFQEDSDRSLGQELQDGVEISAAPIAYFGVVALVNVGLKIHDCFTTVQDCHNDVLLSLNCSVALGLSIIPVGGSGKAKDVIEFAGGGKKYSSSVKKYTSAVQQTILTKNLAGKTLKAADGKSFKIPSDWKKNTVTGNGLGARYVSPDLTKQIRVMAEGIDEYQPSTLGKPYFRIEGISSNSGKKYDTNLNLILSTKYQDSHFPISFIN